MKNTPTQLHSLAQNLGHEAHVRRVARRRHDARPHQARPRRRQQYGSELQVLPRTTPSGIPVAKGFLGDSNPYGIQFVPQNFRAVTECFRPTMC